jgi:hypothetical protein
VSLYCLRGLKLLDILGHHLAWDYMIGELSRRLRRSERRP